MSSKIIENNVSSGKNTISRLACYGINIWLFIFNLQTLCKEVFWVCKLKQSCLLIPQEGH